MGQGETCTPSRERSECAWGIAAYRAAATARRSEHRA